MTQSCKAIGCSSPVHSDLDFCFYCQELMNSEPAQESFDFENDKTDPPFIRSESYRKSSHSEVSMDVYAVHQMFEIHDFSGCIQQASTKLLLSSNNATCKPYVQDISDARDILNRWLELNDSAH